MDNLIKLTKEQVGVVEKIKKHRDDLAKLTDVSFQGLTKRDILNAIVFGYTLKEEWDVKLVGLLVFYVISKVKRRQYVSSLYLFLKQ